MTTPNATRRGPWAPHALPSIAVLGIVAFACSLGAACEGSSGESDSVREREHAKAGGGVANAVGGKDAGDLTPASEKSPDVAPDGGDRGSSNAPDRESETTRSGDAGSSSQDAGAVTVTVPPLADAGSEPPVGPSGYAGMLPQAGTPVVLGNTRIFDDIAGLTWNPRAQELLFVVSQVNQIRRWRAGLADEQNFDVVRPGGEHMDGMKGLDLAPDGALWVCEVRESLPHRVSRSIDGYDHPVTAVDHWQGSPEVAAGDFTSPWYISVRWDGNVYFTDTPHRWSGLPDKSLFRIDRSGQLTMLKHYASDADLSEGGAYGIALSPNQRAFYISTWNHPGYPQLVRFDLDADGSVANETLLMTDEDGPIQSVDGLCIDRAENLYLCTGGGGVRMYSPSGEFLGSIDVPGATDCSFGGADGKTLFVATSGGVAGDKNLYRVPINIPGLP